MWFLQHDVSHALCECFLSCEIELHKMSSSPLSLEMSHWNNTTYMMKVSYSHKKQEFFTLGIFKTISRRLLVSLNFISEWTRESTEQRKYFKLRTILQLHTHIHFQNADRYTIIETLKSVITFAFFGCEWAFRISLHPIIFYSSGHDFSNSSQPFITSALSYPPQNSVPHFDHAFHCSLQMFCFVVLFHYF